jgi:hypothetical protein
MPASLTAVCVASVYYSVFVSVAGAFHHASVSATGSEP